MTPRPARVLIVDDHPLMRHALRQIIKGDDKLRICGEADSAPEALVMAARFTPNLAIVDISLGADSGLELIRRFAAEFPKMRVLIISMHDESLYIERAVRGGAHGFVSKDSSAATVDEAIHQVLDGKGYWNQDLLASLVTRAGRERRPDTSPVSNLSDREFLVFQHLGHGLSTRQIAHAMSVTPKTVESYRHRMKSKLGLKHTYELLHFATEWSLHPK